MRARKLKLRSWSLTFLVLFLVTNFLPLSKPAQAKTIDPLTRRGHQLKITLTRGPQSKTICSNTKMDFGFLITDEDLWVPVPAAQITLTDQSSGATFSGSSSASGTASISLNFVEQGTAKIKVTVSKDGYLPDSKDFTYDVIPCKWLLHFSWIEEYSIMEGSTDPKAGAAFAWEGIITLKNGQANSGTAEITSQTKEGAYRFFLRNQWIKPIDITLEPAVSGQYTLLASGTLQGDWLNLHLETLPLIIPNQVKLKLTDVSGQYQINYLPPVPVLDNKGQCLEVNKLQDFQLPASGGSGIYVTKACFLGVPDHADLTIFILPMDENATYLPARPFAFSLGDQK